MLEQECGRTVLSATRTRADPRRLLEHIGRQHFRHGSASGAIVEPFRRVVGGSLHGNLEFVWQATETLGAANVVIQVAGVEIYAEMLGRCA
jgi:hypothetical protein